MNIFVYPGSFDPVTNGHLDIIDRASKICDKLIVAVLINSSKIAIFSLEERVNLIKTIINGRDNIEVQCFSGLLIDFMRQSGAKTILKGLRAVSDFEYELQMAHLNKIQAPEIETMFMMTNVNYSFLSSSIVKEIARLGGKIDDLVPENIKEEILNKFGYGQGDS